MNESEERIYLNGIDGVTGNYLVQPMSAAEAVAMARGKPEDSGLKDWMKSIWEAMQRPFMGLPMDVDPTDVSQAGWAVVFTPDTPAEVRDAMQPLIAHRQKQFEPWRTWATIPIDLASESNWVAPARRYPATCLERLAQRAHRFACRILRLRRTIRSRDRNSG